MRRALLIVGALIALAAGTVVIARPDLVANFSADTLVIYVIGFGMIVLGFIRAYRGRHRRRQAVDPGELEHLGDHQTPGAALDRSWDEFRFETVAVQVLMRSKGCSEVEARAMLEDGTWTDDDMAAAYFASDPIPETDVDPERARQLIRAAEAKRRTRALEALRAMTHPKVGETR